MISASGSIILAALRARDASYMTIARIDKNRPMF
jgi:hypothetical protein